MAGKGWFVVGNVPIEDKSLSFFRGMFRISRFANRNGISNRLSKKGSLKLMTSCKYNEESYGLQDKTPKEIFLLL
ncbi:hypothetical protein LEP1GSC193_3160 [Leptospira alstonii serovar Pingchang str. 80-412]|uniref:Uncharacterized protein n=2 Tax=Leptospira alstonii TaxID=28452 RepID=M6DGD8_9LEPT|nr:hypothetical protein LEP1GSC194_2939 [Leptospira alstonii serovar Sichuan str. 79601]EQA79361.1 hypothetical protein LEP1GSC193_3160 [Leptospira alstonii serovar Pingchang str. 80-412]